MMRIKKKKIMQRGKNPLAAIPYHSIKHHYENSKLSWCENLVAKRLCWKQQHRQQYHQKRRRCLCISRLEERCQAEVLRALGPRLHLTSQSQGQSQIQS